MTDIFSKEKRSEVMSKIHSRDTKPEMTVRRYLHAAGFRYTLGNRKYPGSPDLVFPSLHAVIFINGCFWHGHEGCRHSHLPKSNVEFWEAKIDRNRRRDAKVKTELEEQGWHVFVVWECELSTKDRREATLSTLAGQLSRLRNQSATSPTPIPSPTPSPVPLPPPSPAPLPTPSYPTEYDDAPGSLAAEPPNPY